MIFGQKINGFIDFFGLLDDIGSSQNHFYLIDFNFERRKSHLLLESSCRSSASIKYNILSAIKIEKVTNKSRFWGNFSSGSSEQAT